MKEWTCFCLARKRDRDDQSAYGLEPKGLSVDWVDLRPRVYTHIKSFGSAVVLLNLGLTSSCLPFCLFACQNLGFREVNRASGLFDIR